MPADVVNITQKSVLAPYAMFRLVLLFVLSISSLHAQDIIQADQYFDAQQYYPASILYQKIVSQDSTQYQATYNLAHCYRHLFKYAESQEYYAVVVRNVARNFPLSTYYYAQMLKYNQHYEEAVYWYNQFVDQASGEASKYVALAEKGKEGAIEAMLARSQDDHGIELIRLPEPVNSYQYQEFAPVIYQHDTIIAYSSTRTDGNEGISNRSGEGFSNQYLIQKAKEDWEDISKEKQFDRLNSKWSDANGSITADGLHYFFTRCSPANDGFCHIYVSTKKNGKWQEAKALHENVNRSGSNSKQPSVSASGDRLYFVSDRPGGSGGTDIWMCSLTDAGEWGTARNLGSVINSENDEISPFFSSIDSLLVFASDGRQGFGGMDLYMVDMRKEVVKVPIPLATPFNSSRDDCYLVWGDSIAYMTSNREGSFDIYSVGRQQNQTFNQLFQGGAGSQLAQYEGEAFESIITDYNVLLSHQEENFTVMRSSGQDYMQNGSSRFVLSADVNDILLEQLRDKNALSPDSTYAVLPAFGNEEDSLSENNLLVSFSTFQVNSGQMVEIRGSVLYKTEGINPVAKQSLYLLDDDGIISKITTTNGQGEFRFVNLEPSSSYQIRYSKTINEAQPNYKLENLRIFGYGNDFVTLHFENIYFDFNQSYLRNEAKVALDELAQFHLLHPESVIEINAFTDSTGNDIYNLQLSRERGQMAFNYLLDKGVDRSALVFNAKGVSTAIESSNSYISQQLNRRVEFYISGQNIRYEQEVVTRLIRPQVTLYTLANETGMSLDEIKRLNGLTSNDLQAYKPIRLYRRAYEKAQGLFYQMQVRSESLNYQ